jgi:hypothetical protein
MNHITLTTDELKDLLKQAYIKGCIDFEVVEVGLESFDPETYADWILHKLTKNQEENGK